MQESPIDLESRILRSLRRIIRRVDVHSRKVNSEFKVTVPQLACLYSLAKNPDQTMSQLAKDVSLGSSTVNGIADRLEVKGLVIRRRGQIDRRKVFLELTSAGEQLVADAPPMLQQTIGTGLAKLPALEMATIALSLEKLVGLMDAEDLDVSPILSSSTSEMPEADSNNTGESFEYISSPEEDYK